MKHVISYKTLKKITKVVNTGALTVADPWVNNTSYYTVCLARSAIRGTNVTYYNTYIRIHNIRLFGFYLSFSTVYLCVSACFFSVPTVVVVVVVVVGRRYVRAVLGGGITPARRTLYLHNTFAGCTHTRQSRCRGIRVCIQGDSLVNTGLRLLSQHIRGNFVRRITRSPFMRRLG